MYFEKPTVRNARCIHVLLCSSCIASEGSDCVIHYLLQDPFPLGEILLGTETEGFSVDEMAPYDLGVGENGFVLNTPNRIYPLQAATSEEKHDWIATLRRVIARASFSSNGVASLSETYETEQ